MSVRACALRGRWVANGWRTRSSRSDSGGIRVVRISTRTFGLSSEVMIIGPVAVGHHTKRATNGRAPASAVAEVPSRPRQDEAWRCGAPLGRTPAPRRSRNSRHIAGSTDKSPSLKNCSFRNVPTSRAACIDGCATKTWPPQGA